MSASEKPISDMPDNEVLGTNNINSQSPLSMDKLSEAFMNDMDIIKEILSSFKEGFENFESEFDQAEQEGDAETMSRLAHGLKGSAGNIRAETLSTNAATLQHKIDDGKEFKIARADVLSSLDALNQQIDALVAREH